MNLEEIEPTLQKLQSEVRALRHSVATASHKEEEILTTGEAAKFLRVARAQIDYLRNSGIIPAIQTGQSRRWLYRKSDLLKLWERQNGQNIKIKRKK